MDQALQLALRGVGWASPNPMVGAIVVRDGSVVGEGYHACCGEAHAEVVALQQAGEQSRGATLYVTLEPCCHHGKTPPCVDRIMQANLARVVVAQEDPNPKVCCKGIEILRQSGLSVEVGCREDEARRVNEAFLKWIVTRKPFVHAKYAMTLDGKIATRTGDSRWISNEESRRRVHWFRAICDAVIVGVGTVERDNPMLDCRLPPVERPWRQPLRVVLDPDERISEAAQVIQTTDYAETLLVLSRPARRAEVWERLGVRTWVCPSENGILDLAVLLDMLGEEKVTGLLVEGGATTHTYFWQKGLVDKYTVFVAPKIIGGTSALLPICGEGIEKMSQATVLENVEIERCGDDVSITGYCNKTS